MKKFLALFFTIALSTAFNVHAAPVANNTPGFIKKATDLGPLDPNSMINVTVWLQLHNEGKLDTLVKEQKQKGSANYKKWITQDQFNASFAPTAKEVDCVQKFLTSRSLSVQAVAEKNMYIKVQGTVRDIQKAFHVQINKYKFNGKTYGAIRGILQLMISRVLASRRSQGWMILASNQLLPDLQTAMESQFRLLR